MIAKIIKNYKKAFVALISIIIVGILISIVLITINNKQSRKDMPVNETVSDKKNNKKEDNSKKEDSNSVNESTKIPQITSNPNQSTEVKKDNNDVKSNSSSNNSSSSSNPSKPNNNDNNNIPTTTPTPPPSKPVVEVPMWSWQIVDYKTLNECRLRGDEFMKQGYGYSCDDVISQNGVYLGQMLNVFEVNTGDAINWR